MSLFNFWRGKSGPPSSTPSSWTAETRNEGPRRQSDSFIRNSTWAANPDPQGTGNYFTTDPLHASAAPPSFTASGEHMPRNPGYQPYEALQQTFLPPNAYSPPRKHSRAASYDIKNSESSQQGKQSEPFLRELTKARISPTRAERSLQPRRLDIIDRMDVENYTCLQPMPSLQQISSQQQMPAQEQMPLQQQMSRQEQTFSQPQMQFVAEADGTIHARINNEGPGDARDSSKPGQTSTILQPTSSTTSSPPNKTSSSSSLRRTSRHSSAPPMGTGEFQTPLSATQQAVRNKYNFARMIPAAAPAHAQMIAHLQNWSLILTQVTDQQLKTQIITAISEKMEKVWMEAMQNGHIPLNWDSDMRTQAQAGKTKIDIAEIDITDNTLTEAELLAKRGRVAQVQDKAKPKKKRAVSPSQEIIVDTTNHKGSKAYGITAGELEDAGISMEVINDRVAEQRLDEFDDLLADALEALDKDRLRESDWLGVLSKTHNNPKGRYLKLYCLWEIPKCQAELQTFNRVMQTFSHPQQIRNTQNRIDVEEMLMDQLLALASELDDMEAGLEDSDSEIKVVTSGPEGAPIEGQGESESDVEEVYDDPLRGWHDRNPAQGSESIESTISPNSVSDTAGPDLDQERQMEDGELIEVQPRERSAFSAPIDVVTGVKRANESAISSSVSIRRDFLSHRLTEIF